MHHFLLCSLRGLHPDSSSRNSYSAMGRMFYSLAAQHLRSPVPTARGTSSSSMSCMPQLPFVAYHGFRVLGFTLVPLLRGRVLALSIRPLRVSFAALRGPWSDTFTTMTTR
jgi:hypothetical protein